MNEARGTRARGAAAACALVFGLVLNVWGLSGLTPSERPFRAHAEDSLAHLVEVEQRSVSQAFGFYVELTSLADFGTLVADTSLEVDRQLVTTFGWELVEVENLLRGVSDLPTLRFRPRGDVDVGGRIYRLWLPTEPSAASHFWLARRGGDLFVVPESLVPVPVDV